MKALLLPTNIAYRERAESYVPLYDMLYEIVMTIRDDPECGRELNALGRRGRKVLNVARDRVAAADNSPRRT